MPLTVVDETALAGMAYQVLEYSEYIVNSLQLSENLAGTDFEFHSRPKHEWWDT